MLKLATILSLAGMPLAAETLPCAPHNELVEHLASKYDEHQIALGAETRGPMVEVFVSAGGTWTLIVTTPDKNACVVAAGENWMMIDWPPANGQEG